MTDRTDFAAYQAFIDRINRTTDREIDENARLERSPLAERWAYLDWQDRINGHLTRRALEAGVHYA